MTTAGGVEEDLIKCLAHTYLGDFNLSGKELRQRGINRLAAQSTSGQMKNLAQNSWHIGKNTKRLTSTSEYQNICIVIPSRIKQFLFLCFIYNTACWYHLFDFPWFSAGVRIGNLLVPNDNYCKFEDWLMPILDQMVLEQNTEVDIFIDTL